MLPGGLTFGRSWDYTVCGHENRGAERLRSAVCRVPYILIRVMPA